MDRPNPTDHESVRGGLQHELPEAKDSPTALRGFDLPGNTVKLFRTPDGNGGNMFATMFPVQVEALANCTVFHLRQLRMVEVGHSFKRDRDADFLFNAPSQHSRKPNIRIRKLVRSGQSGCFLLVKLETLNSAEICFSTEEQRLDDQGQLLRAPFSN
jgi:hypothetical protein